MKKIFYLIVMCIFMMSCITISKIPDQIDPYNYDLVRNNIITQYDKFEGITIFKGPSISINKSNIFSNSSHEYFLRKIGGKDYSVNQIYLIVYLNNWFFLDRAFDTQQNNLTVNRIDREVISGNLVREDIAINISRNYLAFHRDTGIEIKVYGQRGDLVLNIPPQYIQAFIDNN